VNVVIVYHGIFPGYVAPVPKELAKNLHALGHASKVIVVGQRAPETAETEKFKFPVDVVETGSWIRTYRELKQSVADAEVIHYFPGKGLELLPLLNLGATTIFNYLSGSVTGDKFRDRSVNLMKRAQPIFADAMVCTDESLANTLRPLAPIPIRLLPVGYPDDLFYPCPPPPAQSTRRLVYHGAVRRARRLEDLVHMLARLPPIYILTIVGGGLAADEEYRQTLGELATRIGCADRLELTNMPQPMIREVLNSAYMGVSYVPPEECYQDQFVLKTLEYLACHRPVLTTGTRYTKRFAQTIGSDRLLLSDGSVSDMVEKVIGSDQYVASFYEPARLEALSVSLKPYSSRSVVEHDLVPLYQSLRKRP